MEAKTQSLFSDGHRRTSGRNESGSSAPKTHRQVELI